MDTDRLTPGEPEAVIADQELSKLPVREVAAE